MKKKLKYFIENFSNKIYTFSDEGYSDGNLYLKIGFKKLYELKPDYKFVIVCDENEYIIKRAYNAGVAVVYATAPKKSPSMQIRAIRLNSDISYLASIDDKTRLKNTNLIDIIREKIQLV